MRFCLRCGSGDIRCEVPPMDNCERFVCGACNYIHYENPHVVVGCIPVWKNRILLCQRAIEPRLGLWTLPAGFMELGETAPQGASRETLEEANAHVEIEALFALLSLPYLNQVYLIYRARMLDETFSPGSESSEVVLLQEDQIPWEQLAFASIYYVLKLFFQDREQGSYGIHTGDVQREQDRYSLHLHAEDSPAMLYTASGSPVREPAHETSRRKCH